MFKKNQFEILSGYNYLNLESVELHVLMHVCKNKRKSFALIKTKLHFIKVN